MQLKMIPLRRWAEARGLAIRTAQGQAERGDIPGAELRQESRGPVWWVPEDAQPVARPRGRPRLDAGGGPG